MMDDNTMKDADKEMIEKLSPSNTEIVLVILDLIQTVHDVPESKKTEMETRT